MAVESERIEFSGNNYFRQRLVLATLSGHAIRIKSIREDDTEPGMNEHEADFIWLLDKITNGSIIEVNETGTKLYYNPGILEGGSVEHQCSHERSIGYYLEPLIMLAPFAKKPISITLKGITNGLDDPSVDYYRLCTLPLLKKILPNCMLTLKVFL
jgi:RNA 3'-terminal phosphate cyclase-like protein